jgi:ribosome-binding factor A|tara:strand:+ start:41 stop:247 length:207 start_codon:yes stop_codon:yes gene_type:complete
MKLFLKKDCDFCNQLLTDNIDVETIYVDSKKYKGLMPQQVPVLQFSNDAQIIDAAFINTLFDEIRRQK